METETVLIPQQFTSFIKQKLERNSQGGRPNFLQELSKIKDARDETLNILELAWLKNRSIGSIARKYGVEYTTIYRLIKDVEPSKEVLVTYLELVPRRKIFYNKNADSSDYETVQAYINKAKRFELKRYRRYLKLAEKCWRFLKYKDPFRWSADDVLKFLHSLNGGPNQSTHLDAIRCVAPQIRDDTSPHYIPTGRYREKIGIRKKDLFGPEVNMIIQALKSQGLTFNEIILKLHITIGAREGQDGKSGITGLSWDRFKRKFTTVDLYESKVRGGIWWRDCPLTLFFDDLPNQLKTLWIDREKPTTDKLILNGYHELLQIYKKIRKALAEYYEGKVDPSLFVELTTLRPHDADKIHVNLLWEAEIPLEVVAGQYLGRGEGIGLMGRGWLDINTIKKHYLSLTQRSERFRKLRSQVQTYSQRFNGKTPAEMANINLNLDGNKWLALIRAIKK